MQFSLEVKGAEAVRRRMQYLGTDGIQTTLVRGALASAILVEGSAKGYIRNTGSPDEHQSRAFQIDGNTYLSDRSLRRISGMLANSITHKLFETAKGQVEATVGTNSVYGRIHEVGGVIKAKHAAFLVFKTDDGKFHRVKSITMPARPYLLPALFKNEKQITQLFSDAFWQEVDRIGGEL